MDFNNLIVSVEINDTSLRGLQESGTIAIVTTLRDEEVSSTQFAPRTNQFRVKGVSQGLVSPYEERSVFALQSVSSEAYLAINSSDRTVMLLDEQFPPPDAFCFKFAAEHGPFSVEVPCSIQPLDQGPVKDAVDPGITLSLCIRAMQTSSEKLKAVESQYNQQLSIIAALQQANAVTRDESDDIHANHDPLSEDHSAHSVPIKRGKDSDGGREKSYLDSEKMIARAKEMIDSGDLKVAKEALGRFYDDDNLPKTVEKSVLIKIAKLFVILSDTVYFRDAVYRDAVLKSAGMCKDDANKWWTENSSWSEWAEWSTYFEEVESHDDQARTRINLVASKLGLKFQPLCSLSQPHEIGLGGPYCGAFYDDGDNPFIVLAIKGTGSLSDWYTNFMVATTAGNSGSPLNGQVHHGFYRGFFDGSYPVGLRGPQGPKFKFETGLPFQMLRLQLWRLEKQILSARPRTPNVNTRVQLWTTGHSLGGAYATILWSALLDQPKMLDSTIRDLVTFGAPRVGDREFVEDLMRVKGERKIWRFVNGADVVPRILYYGVGITYYHPDTLINCFPYSIYRGSTELGPQPPDSWVPQGLKDILKEIYRLVVHSEDPIKDVQDYKNDHELERYWNTLREGSKSIGEGSW